jgi:hypothetical protein
LAVAPDAAELLSPDMATAAPRVGTPTQIQAGVGHSEGGFSANDAAFDPNAIPPDAPIGTIVENWSIVTPSGATYSWSLSGPGASVFRLVSTGASTANLVTTASLVSLEGQAISYTVNVTSSDPNETVSPNTGSKQIGTFKPTDIELSNDRVKENQASGTFVGTLSATDRTPNETFTYALNGFDLDNGYFTIVGDQLRTAETFDYESKRGFRINVQVTDSQGNIYNEEFLIRVIDCPEADPGAGGGGGTPTDGTPAGGVDEEGQYDPVDKTKPTNKRPKDIKLTPASVLENQPIGTVVGTLEASDPNPADTHTFFLVNVQGATDNNKFSIVGNQLRTAQVLNREQQSTYAIAVTARDQVGNFYTKLLTVSAINVNETPTALTLSSTSVTENQPVGTNVGTFSTTDPDFGSTFTYTLVSGSGSTDNASFTIVGNQLRTTQIFDFETKSSYAIRVRSTDQGGLSVEQAFTISVQNANEFGVGSEFRVNTSTSGAQGNSRVAMDAQGNFVVVWRSPEAPASEIVGQRYAANGERLGNEFQINTTTTGAQDFPDVAMDADGDFVVVWQSAGNPGSSFAQIVGRRYNAAGAAQGGEFLISTSTGGHQVDARVAMEDNGDFVVAWTNTSSSVSDVTYRRYNAAGTALSTELRANTFTASNQNSPDIAVDADGDFVITWSSYGQDAVNSWGIYGQRFTNTGALAGSEFRVNTTTVNSQRISAVDMDDDGDFVVGWASNLQDGSDYGVYAQRYNAAGVAQGGEIAVNTFTTGRQGRTQIAVDADGDFIVAWLSNLQDGSSYGMYAQRFNANGTRNGVEMRANSFTANQQAFGAVAMDPDGDAVVTWSSNLQDGSSYGIYAQRFSAPRVNQAPTALTLTGNTVDEELFANNLVGTFSSTDPNAGDAFTYSLVSGTGSTDNNAFLIVGNQLRSAISFDFESKSSYSIRVRTTDIGGLFVESTFTINVNNINDFPESYDTEVEGLSNTSITGRVWGWDPEGAPLTYAKGFLDASNGVATINPNGTFTYRPNANFTGTDLVTFTVSDGVNQNFGSFLWITIKNRDPVAYNATLTTPSNQRITGGRVWGWDPEAKPLSYFVADGIPAGQGTLTFRSNGTFDYTPPPNFAGTTKFMFAVDDGTGLSATATITINVTNRLPIAYDGTATTLSNQRITGGRVWGWDPEGQTLSYAVVGSPVNGTVNLQPNGTFTFTPTTNFVGTASFQFRVTDSQSGMSNTATMTITVQNRLPVAYNGTATMGRNTTLTGGRVWGWDPEAKALTYAVVGSPVNGTVNLQPSGVFSFTPTANFTGTASFQFRVTDADGGVSNTATMTITVAAADQPPRSLLASRLLADDDEEDNDR